MSTGIVDVFADAGIAAFEEGLLGEGLRQLGERLEAAGAGDLLAVLVVSCFGRHDEGVCERCGAVVRRPPGDPHPKPQDPPKPPPKPGTK